MPEVLSWPLAFLSTCIIDGLTEVLGFFESTSLVGLSWLTSYTLSLYSIILLTLRGPDDALPYWNYESYKGQVFLCLAPCLGLSWKVADAKTAATSSDSPVLLLSMP